MSEEKRKVQVDRRLSHLSEEELKKVMWLYFGNNVSVKDIVKRYRIDVDPGSLYKILPPIQSKRVCKHCGEILYRKVEPRNHYRNKYNRYDYFCLNCGHEEFEKSQHMSCSCEHCTGKVEPAENQKKDLIRKCYTKEHRHYVFGNLSFGDQVALLYLIKKNKEEQKGIMIPFKETPEWTERLDRFIDKGYLSVSPESELCGFKDCEEFPKIFYTYKVKYDVNVIISEKDRVLIDNRKFFQKNAIWAERLSLFKEYIYEDLLRVFDSMMKEKGMLIEKGTRAKKSFKELIDKLSYGEVLFFLDKVRKHCLEKIEKETMTEAQAGGMALGNVSKFYDRNVEKGWAIYKRRFERVGEELWFVIQNVFDSDLTSLDEVPSVDYLMSITQQSNDESEKNEYHAGQNRISAGEDSLNNYVRSGETTEAFAKKICQLWILCFPEMRFGELMTRFWESLEHPSEIEDEDLLEEFRKFCRRKTVLEEN